MATRLDMSWQDLKDRPYKGEGETVDVIGGETAESSGYVELDSEFTLAESQFELLEAVMELESPTPAKLSDELGVTKRTVRNFGNLLEEHGIGERDKESGEISTFFSLDDRFKFSNGITSDLLVSDTHPLKLTPMQREILAFAARNPTVSQGVISEKLGVNRRTVNEALNNHGDPRRPISEISVGRARSELELVEARIESLKERRAELKKHIKTGEGAFEDREWE